MKTKEPTTTSLVTEALAIMDDFMNATDLAELIGRTPHRVMNALHGLKSRQVVDSVLNEGRLFWFLTGDDARTRVFAERLLEEDKIIRNAERRRLASRKGKSKP